MPCAHAIPMYGLGYSLTPLMVHGRLDAGWLINETGEAFGKKGKEKGGTLSGCLNLNTLGTYPMTQTIQMFEPSLPYMRRR